MFLAQSRKEMAEWLVDDLDQLAEECEAEGYPANGSNYELHAADIIDWYRQCYPQWMN